MAEEAEEHVEDVVAEEAAPEGEHQEPPEGGETGGEQPLGVEDLARDLGWKPESEWKGPKDNWTPAADFLRHKVAKADRVADEIRGVKDTLDRVSRTSAAIADRHIREETARIQARFTEAVETGDTEAAWQASQELQAARHTAPATDPAADFRARNPWFGQNDEASAYAFGICEVNKHLPFEEQAKKAEEAVRKRFPELFEQPARQERQPAKSQPAVAQPTSRTARPTPRAKGAADLPLEARRAGEDFVRRGRVKSLDDYAKVYFEENA